MRWARLPAVKRNCFYHAGCPDGFGAAWALWRAWGEDGRFIPHSHDDPLNPVDFEGDQVVFVDIAPPNQAIREFAEVATEFVLLDHHLTARDRYASDLGLENLMAGSAHTVRFDLDHSGAVLAWNHFHPGEPAPDLLAYVEDQDLWNWKLARSEEINAAIGSHPREFAVWDELASRPIESLAQEGEPIVRANRIEVKRALHAAHPVVLGTRRIEAVNSAHLRSALGHELAKRARFGQAWGLVYRIFGDRVNATLYSIGDVDVSELACQLGGGGHRNASGFTVSLRRWLDDFAV
ncbi:MAG: hypothetical protein V3T01_07475 [Myxococcota bacterium]